MDFGGFLTALIGVGFGYFYFWRHRNIVRQLFFNLRLLLDDAHLTYCYELLQNPKYYEYFASQLSFLPEVQHADALHRSRLGAKASLTAMYKAYGKHLGVTALAYFALPLILLFMVGTAGYFVASIFVTIAFSVFYDVLLAGGKGNVLNARLETLVKQAYSFAGYRSVAETPPAIAPVPAKPSPQARKPYATYPLPNQAAAYGIAPLEPVVATPLAAQSAPALFEAPDDDEPLRFTKDENAALRNKLTFKNIWWGTDALLCMGIIVFFWATDARTITDYLLVPFLYILFLQIFFVPTWFVIRIARKLLATS